MLHIQCPEISDVADAKHTCHQAPLGGTRSPQESFVGSDEHHSHRQEQEQIDWNEDDKHVVPSIMNPVVLNGYRKICPEEYAPICTARGYHRIELLETQKADQSEEHDGIWFLKNQCHRHHGDDDPPRKYSWRKVPKILFRLQPTDQFHDQGG